MIEFNDHEYAGAFPAPTTWVGLSPNTIKTMPVPAIGPPSPPPHFGPHQAIALAAGALFWNAQNVGYGEHATYAVHWLLAGIPLGPAEVCALRRLARSRATMLARAYLQAAAPPHQIVRQPVFPLIESTELGVVHFLLGMALSQITAREAILGRTGLVVSRLFHARLLRISAVPAFTVSTVPLGKTPDFLGFDGNGGTHIVESKGEGGTLPYKRLAHGLDQVHAVNYVLFPGGLFVPPESRNVCVSYHSVPAGQRVAVFHLPQANAQHMVAGNLGVGLGDGLVLPNVPIDHRERRKLIGLYLLGLWCSVRAMSPGRPDADWLIVFQDDLEIDAPRLQVAMPRSLNLLVEETWQAFIARPERDIQSLEDTLVELGRRVVTEFDNRAWLPPQGFAVTDSDAGDPWLFVRMR